MDKHKINLLPNEKPANSNNQQPGKHQENFEMHVPDYENVIDETPEVKPTDLEEEQETPEETPPDDNIETTQNQPPKKSFWNKMPR